MRISRISGDDIAATRIKPVIKEGGKATLVECSAHYTNRALRTLKRMFSKAVEWKLLADSPRFKLLKAYGRDTKISPSTERILLNNLSEPISNKRNARMRSQTHDVLVIAQDTGMRPSEIFRMTIENLDFARRHIWNPYGKTEKARRFVAISERMAKVLTARCNGRKEGWVFPSARSKCGHITSIAKSFQAARARTGVSKKVVPYSARHTYGSYALASTGNLFAVAASMGHVDTKSMEPYQHHDLTALREAIDHRNNSLSSFGRTFGHSEKKEHDAQLDNTSKQLNVEDHLGGPGGI